MMDLAYRVVLVFISAINRADENETQIRTRRERSAASENWKRRESIRILREYPRETAIRI